MVGEAVQQRAGEALRAEDFGPLVESEIGGYKDGAPLVALAEHLEEQFRAGAGQLYKAQLVDDQQVEPRQLSLQIQEPSLVPGLHQFVDQCGGSGEAHRHSPLAGGQAQPQGDMGLAGAAVADGNDVLTVFTPGQLHHQCLVQRRHGREVEAVQAFGCVEPGRPVHFRRTNTWEQGWQRPATTIGTDKVAEQQHRSHPPGRTGNTSDTSSYL